MGICDYDQEILEMYELARALGGRLVVREDRTPMSLLEARLITEGGCSPEEARKIYEESQTDSQNLQGGKK